MNAPRDLGPDFRSWLDSVPPMPPELPQRTLDVTRRTRQRRRWLWFLPGPRPTAGAEDERSEPARHQVLPARPRGLLPADMDGTTMVMSAKKAVGLAAVAALIGSVVLVTRPLSVGPDPQGPTVSVPMPHEVSVVHGTMDLDCDVQSSATEHHDWGALTMDLLLEFEFDVDEPRLRGDGRMRFNEYNVKGLSRGPTAATFYIENDDGSWSGESRGYRGPDLAGYHFELHLDGAGGYAGLTAILTGDQRHYGDELSISGMIIDGSLPPMPAPAKK